jgi:hypothetical protein
MPRLSDFNIKEFTEETDLTPDAPIDEPIIESIDIPKPRKSKIYSGLVQLYGSVALGVNMFDPHCGAAIATNIETMATSMDQLAKENDSVRRVMEKLISGGAWGAVIAAHSPVIIAVATHHGSGMAERTRNLFGNRTVESTSNNVSQFPGVA